MAAMLTFPQTRARTTRTRTTRSARRNPESVFNFLREIGINPGMVEQLETYNTGTGEQTVKMFEGMFDQFLTCEAEPNLQGMVRLAADEDKATYKATYDQFMSVAW